MVQVIPMPTRASILGEALGSGFQQGFSPAVQEAMQYNLQRSRLQNALNEVKGLATKENVTPYDLTSALIGATAGIPGSERYVGTLLQTLLPTIQAKQAGKVQYDIPAAERGQQVLQEQPITKRKALPGFAGQAPAQAEQASPFFPRNIGPQEYPGNVPQAATTGQKQPILNNTQLINEGKRIAAESTAAGIPMTPLDGYNIAKDQNEERKTFNLEVDKELEQRIGAQQKYGALAESKLEKLFPEATDEQRAWFKKKGEDISQRSKSEADAERYLAKEAVKFKNTLANVRNSIPAARTYNMPKQALLGTDRAFENRRNDLRIKLQPLLSEGLYDTARNLLDGIGYDPEEIESIVGNLSDDTMKKVAQMPKIERPKEKVKGAGIAPGGLAGIPSIAPYSQQQQQETSQSLEDILTNDPNANLILLRKGFEEKGIDWQLFKNTLNDLILQEKFNPNPDQMNHLSDLDEPPLNNLEVILHKLGLIGR